MEFDAYHLDFKRKYKDYYLFADRDKCHIICRPVEYLTDANREWILCSCENGVVTWNTKYIKRYDDEYTLTVEEVDDIWYLVKKYLEYWKGIKE